MRASVQVDSCRLVSIRVERRATARAVQLPGRRGLTLLEDALVNRGQVTSVVLAGLAEGEV